MIHFPSPHEKKLPDEIRIEKVPITHSKDAVCNRVIGSLVGLAIGDALGASVEFRPHTYLVAHPIKKMEGGGTWGLSAGKWTDDTSMALCSTASLIECNGFNPYDQMVRYKWWLKHGYFSSTGHCFDIGEATRQSLNEFSVRQKLLKTLYRCHNESEVDGLSMDSVKRVHRFNVFCGNEGSAGNGALMRLAPVPLFFFRTPQIAIEYATSNTSLTHASSKARDASRFYAALIIGALHGLSKEELLDENFYLKHQSWFGNTPLDQDVMLVLQGSYKKDKDKSGYDQGIRGKGFVISALEAALWAFWSDGDSFERGVLAAVNLGDDTDTTAAIYGQLAGAYYGHEKIPKEWIEQLYAHDLIVSMAEWIHFGGTQTRLNHPEDHSICTKATSTQSEKFSQQNSQLTPSPTETELTQNTNIDTIINSHNNVISTSQPSSVLTNSLKPSTEFNRSVSSDSAFTHCDDSAKTSFRASFYGFEVSKTSTGSDSHDDITKKTFAYPFHRK